MVAFFLGHTEIIVILIIALLLFGTRLPKVARSLGQGIKEFKGGLHEVRSDVEKADEDPPRKAD
jgi:sec-independent protein translocase protein TatA